MKYQFVTYVSIIVALFSFVSISNIAQGQTEPQTLFGNGQSVDIKSIGFFIAPAVGFTSLDGGSTALMHIRGGISWKDRVSLGAFYNVSLNEVNPNSELLPNIYMDYWAAGGFAEYTLMSNKLLHLTFPLFIGFGEVQMDNENGDAGLGEANFFKIEPSALLEINLTKYARFNSGLGYRFIGPMTYRNFDQSDISGITFYIGFKFGLFR
jgi:hypothetical protein